MMCTWFVLHVIFSFYKLDNIIYYNIIKIIYILINSIWSWIVSVPPLFVIEFLHRVVSTFEDYFAECSESAIKDNYVVVYEVVLITIICNI